MNLPQNNVDDEEGWFIDRLINRNKNAGKLVETRSGHKGIVKSSEPIINGKVAVHLFDGGRILCRPQNLKVIGFSD